MPTNLPTRGFRQPVVLVNADGSPASITATLSDTSPGTVVTTPADVVIGIGATVALPALPTNLRRFTVQNTGATPGSRIRVREVGAGAGRGIILPNLSSRVYGGLDGAVAALEVEEVSGVATTVCVQYERD